MSGLLKQIYNSMHKDYLIFCVYVVIVSISILSVHIKKNLINFAP